MKNIVFKQKNKNKVNKQQNIILMKKIVALSIFAMISSFTFAQQVSLNSHYMLNDFVLNPAFAGAHKDVVPLTLTVRKQWTGFNGAPITQQFSANADIGANFGLGLHFFNDLTGPTRRTGFNLATSYKIPLDYSRRHSIRFGLSFILFEHVFDRNKLTYEMPYDNTIDQIYNQNIIPDANFGMLYMRDSTIYGGFSVWNLIQSRADITHVSSTYNNNINRLYYLYGGYNYSINPDVMLKPSMLLQFQGNAPASFDVNVITKYKNMYWGGISYRYQDAVVIILGIDWNKFTFAYSYDITTSDIRKYSGGSHEFTFGYALDGKGMKFLDGLVRKRSSYE